MCELNIQRLSLFPSLSLYQSPFLALFPPPAAPFLHGARLPPSLLLPLFISLRPHHSGTVGGSDLSSPIFGPLLHLSGITQCKRQVSPGRLERDKIPKRGQSDEEWPGWKGLRADSFIHDCLMTHWRNNSKSMETQFDQVAYDMESLEAGR